MFTIPVNSLPVSKNAIVFFFGNLKSRRQMMLNVQMVLEHKYNSGINSGWCGHSEKILHFEVLEKVFFTVFFCSIILSKPKISIDLHLK
jgi:hypothetical protein